jgi:Suppressor of fused protein (SUFU)
VSWWFGKEKTPDGTVIVRHNKVDRQIGFTDTPTAGFAQAREGAYEKLFGKALTVSHELVAHVPHIDVYVFRRTSKRPEGDQSVYALVTGGMSDLEMTVPRAAKSGPRRVELIFYCAEPREEYIAALRWVAHFPHDGKSWLGYGHTLPNGNPPEPFWGSSVLDTLLFVPPIVNKDRTLPEELKLGGEPIHLLWVVPLTTAECNLKLEKGFAAIMDLFQKNHHPHIFDPNRNSYV